MQNLITCQFVIKQDQAIIPTNTELKVPEIREKTHKRTANQRSPDVMKTKKKTFMNNIAGTDYICRRSTSDPNEVRGG